MNLNLYSTFAKSMNLNFDFSKSMNLNLVFLKSMNLNLKIKKKMNGSNPIFNYWFKPSSFSKILLKCQTQVTASYLPFCDIFAPEKVSLLKLCDEVIAYNLWFSPSPNQKSWLRRNLVG